MNLLLLLGSPLMRQIELPVSLMALNASERTSDPLRPPLPRSSSNVACHFEASSR